MANYRIEKTAMSVHKIKAFTLTEIMIVMVITAIVAGLAFTAITMVQRNIDKIAQNYTYKTEIQQLQESIQLDFNKYRKITWNANKNELQFETPIKTKLYQLEKDSIVTAIKTYRIKIKTKKAYFKGKEVKKGQIDAIKLIFNQSTIEDYIFIFKRNDISSYFEEWE